MSLFSRRPDPRDLVIERLMQQNQDLLDRLQETIGQIHVHQVQRATESPVSIPQERPEHPVFEDQADVMYAYDTGQISERELEETLQEMGFMGTDIQFAAT